MNKRTLVMAMSMFLVAGLVAGCSKSEKEESPTEEPTSATLAATYRGWTLGSNAYAPYIPSEGDELTIELTNVIGTLCNLTYVSETWGTAVLKDVSVTRNDTAYILSKPVVATIRQDHSAWDFSAAVDSVAMPNRNPQGGDVTIKNYPVVLTQGYIATTLDRWQVDFKAYLVPRSEHTMTMSFRNGSIPPAQ